MNIKKILEKMSKEEISNYIKSKGSVFCKTTNGRIIVEHIYPLEYKSIDLLLDKDISNSSFKIIDDKYFYKKYFIKECNNNKYYLCFDYNKKSKENKWKTANFDKYCKNNLTLNNNPVSYQSYIFPFEEKPKKRNIVYNKIFSSIMNENFEYKIINIGVPKKVIVITDGSIFLESLFLDESFRKNNIDNIAIVYLKQNNRMVELGANDRFCKFLNEELVQKIKSDLSVDFSANDFILFGASLGGLTGICMPYFKCNSFGKLICLSSSLWWNVSNLKENLFNFYSNNTISQKIYFAYNNNESNSLIIKNCKDFYQIAKHNNIINFELGGSHSYLNWEENLIFILKNTDCLN